MRRAKRERLVAAGWKVGTVAELLGLDEAEAGLVDLKLALGRTLREARTARGLTQVELARRLRSSQSRIAKMEAADASVSIDLLIRSLLALGARRSDIAASITDV